MGCCISAGPRRSVAEEAPPAEEETVKEVLMESVPVVQNQKGGGDEGMKGMPEVNLGRAMVDVAPTAEIRCDLKKGNGEIEIVSEVVSEVSEICSYSGSYSTTTVTATAAEADEERKDDEEDGVVNQRPPVKKRRVPGGGRGRREGRRAIAAAAVAPEKRGQAAPLRGRSIAVAGQPRNAVQLENGRRGEGSGRRGGGGEGFVPPRRELGVGPIDGVSRDDVVPVEEAESLENPIVSLECFIFL